MPYIKPDRRKVYDPAIEKLVGLLQEMVMVDNQIHKEDLHTICTNLSADTTYIIYRLLVSTYGTADKWYDKMDAIKALVSAKAEFYENIIKPHEVKAKYRNGDIVP